MQTFPAPPSATVLEYNWELSVVDAINVVEQFQTFVQTNISAKWGGAIDLQKGTATGRVWVNLSGGWYGPADQLAAVMAPFLSKVPKPSSVSLTPGTYINSVIIFGGLNRLNTTGIPDTHDTFYAKSLMVPEASPMSTGAISEFISYLGNQGFTADTVR